MIKISEVVLQSKADAQAVLDAMHSLLEQYEQVAFADMLELCGIASTFGDQNIGWTELNLNVEIKEVKDGYILDLPAPNPL